MRVLILSTRIVKMLKAFVWRTSFWCVEDRYATVLTWNKMKISVFILDANHVKFTQMCSDKKQKHLRQCTRGERQEIVFCFWLFLSNLFPLKEEDILTTNFIHNKRDEYPIKYLSFHLARKNASDILRLAIKYIYWCILKTKMINPEQDAGRRTSLIFWLNCIINGALCCTRFWFKFRFNSI